MNVHLPQLLLFFVSRAGRWTSFGYTSIAVMNVRLRGILTSVKNAFTGLPIKNATKLPRPPVMSVQEKVKLMKVRRVKTAQVQEIFHALGAPG